MEFPDKIKWLRNQENLTQKEMSDSIGVSVITIQSWEKGTKSPSMSAIISIANLFSVSTDYLLGFTLEKERHSQPVSDTELQLLEDYRLLDKHGREVVEAICSIEKSRVLEERTREQKVVKIKNKKPRHRIPHYFVPSAAGISAPLDNDDYEMILVDDSVPYDADFAVDIQGDSMSPFIHDGDMVFVKRDCKLNIGDVGIFCVDGAMYCKQYYIDDERNLVLVSANPDLQHTNIYVDADSDQSVVCYGKVLLGIRMTLPKYFLQEI